MSPFGKYVFIWKVPALLGGNPQNIGETALSAGIDTLIVKFVNGKYVYTPPGFATWGINLKKEHVLLWQSLGLRVWGYAYILGENPSLEAEVAAKEALNIGLDGVAFDVEIEFETAQAVATAVGTKVGFIEVTPQVNLGLTLKVASLRIAEGLDVPPQALMKAPFEVQANPVGNAHTYMQSFKLVAPTMPTVFICFPLFRSPNTGGTWHDKSMYTAFMQYCDFGMPMVYWWGSYVANMLWMLNHSLAQWSEIAGGKPIIPIGRLYTGDGGTATTEAIAAFGQELHTRNLIGGGGWHFGTGITNEGWWKAFTEWPQWQVQPPPPPSTPFLERPEAERWYIVRDDLLGRGVIDA